MISYSYNYSVIYQTKIHRIVYQLIQPFVHLNIQDEDELSKLINEAVEKVVGRIASSRINQQNYTVNKDK